MIEKSILLWLMDDTAITTALGGSKIYYQRAPEEAEMPWIVVFPMPGSERNQLTKYFTEPRTRVHVEIDAYDAIQSREIAELVVRRLDYYRGDMADSEDVYLRCSAPFSMDGFAGVSRHIVPVTALEKETIIRPVG